MHFERTQKKLDQYFQNIIRKFKKKIWEVIKSNKGTSFDIFIFFLRSKNTCTYTNSYKIFHSINVK